MGRNITDYFLYRWRYIVGYSLVALVVILMLTVAGLFIPGGLSANEMNSVVVSKQLSWASFDPSAIINLPYHVLQRLSLDTFGASVIAIKLPSLVLGLFSIVGMLILLRMWFRQNVAVLTTILVVTTGSLLFISQYGAPNIMYIFTSVWILVAAMFVSRKAAPRSFWKLILFVMAAISLYTPLSLYILIALVSAIAFHPHLRYIVRRMSRVRVLIALTCAVVISLPLLYSLFMRPESILTLLGVPAVAPDIFANAGKLFTQYFDFISPSSGVLIAPIYGLGTMLLVLLGIFSLATTKYTARSYIITAWIGLLIPVMLINPAYVSITFVPVVLLIAMGIQILIRSWYQLFPLNPYARVAGLIPLSILIVAMVVSGIDRFAYGYHYDPATTDNFSNDLTILNGELRDIDGKAILLVSKEQEPFFSAISSYKKDLTVTSERPVSYKTLLVSHDAVARMEKEIPYRIVTNRSSDDGDRFYIYKTDQK